MSDSFALLPIIERIFATVFPLFAMVMVGFLYARKTDSDMGVANRINIDIFVPALIFSVMASKSFDLLSYLDLMLGTLLMVIGSGLLALPVCKWLGVSPQIFAPPTMFNNCGNLGLPLALLAFGEAGLSAAIAMFLVSTLLHFSLGVYILHDKAQLRPLATNPMVMATAAGLVWSLSGWTLPVWTSTPIDMLGQISIPLMLFALGVRMTDVDFADWRSGLFWGLYGPLTGFMVAYPFALLAGLSSEHTAYFVLFSVLPPAVLNFMLAERYKQAPHTVASIVLLGNIASLAVVPVALFFVLD